MGLPLFVAPIESDLKSKSSEKANSLRPTRSSIRHSRRPDVAPLSSPSGRCYPENGRTLVILRHRTGLRVILG
ncbi:hypothetical protein HYQ45_005812 [Verticillium longisporum]|uniref:Uncharacterized protein n=1 Tax=Verticillium longisporum TaxID=100787 RepID=A0A8I3AT53_VERLO|nr:hypothetical protein HYQ45_005812 [Verticillium longisporum]